MITMMVHNLVLKIFVHDVASGEATVVVKKKEKGIPNY